MPKEIRDFFSKQPSYADIRREALEERKKLLQELNITTINEKLEKQAKQKRARKKAAEEVVPEGPVRKSRRLQGEAPEIIVDEFYMREAKPYTPSKSEKELLAEEEGKISYDGVFDASELATQGDIDSLFDTLKKESTSSSSDVVDVAKWTSHISYSGCNKVVPERIYSMAIHPQCEKLLIAVGDKGGKIGFWSLPPKIDDSSLPTLEDGKKDVSDIGSTWQFKISNEPVTRMFYSEDGLSMYCCSYDKSIKRLDIESKKFETMFKLNKQFDDNIFLHHCVPLPSSNHSFFVSLSNGYEITIKVKGREVLTIDERSGNIESCFQAHPKKVNTIDVHPSKSYIVTASLARSVKLWDIRKLPTTWIEHFHEYVKDVDCLGCVHDYSHALSVNSAFFNGTGDMIVTTCQDNHLRVFSTLIKDSSEDCCVSISHRNQTGKWLTKFMAEFYKPASMVNPNALNYFYCGSMDEPRQINIYSAALLKSKRPVVKALPSLFSNHITSIQSVVRMHPHYPLLACGNTSGRVTILL